MVARPASSRGMRTFHDDQDCRSAGDAPNGGSFLCVRDKWLGVGVLSSSKLCLIGGGVPNFAYGNTFGGCPLKPREPYHGRDSKRRVLPSVVDHGLSLVPCSIPTRCDTIGRPNLSFKITFVACVTEINNRDAF